MYVQVFWFGPLLGGPCGGVLFDVIFSTKSSFARIRNCFTVFHRREEDVASEMGEKRHDLEHQEPADGEEVGERRKDGTAPIDELEVLSESKDQPSTEHKPRRGMHESVQYTTYTCYLIYFVHPPIRS